MRVEAPVTELVVQAGTLSDVVFAAGLLEVRARVDFPPAGQVERRAVVMPIRLGVRRAGLTAA